MKKSSPSQEYLTAKRQEIERQVRRFQSQRSQVQQEEAEFDAKIAQLQQTPSPPDILGQEIPRQHLPVRRRALTPDGYPVARVGPTVRQRSVGHLRGDILTRLQELRLLTPPQWERLGERRKQYLHRADLMKWYEQPLVDIQQAAAEAVEAYIRRHPHGARGVMAEIVGNGKLQPWINDPWFLEQLREAFPSPGSGRQPTITPEKKEQIILKCKHWSPICKALNKAFKELWKQAEYQASELHRKEARGRLAQKLNISVNDVEAIESYLQKPSRTAHKSTPFSAMIRMVAREFPGIGEKTVEDIWEDHVKRRPEESGKRRKTSTIQTAGRTA